MVYIETIDWLIKNEAPIAVASTKESQKAIKNKKKQQHGQQNKKDLTVFIKELMLGQNTASTAWAGKEFHLNSQQKNCKKKQMEGPAQILKNQEGNTKLMTKNKLIIKK